MIALSLILMLGVFVGTGEFMNLAPDVSAAVCTPSTPGFCSPTDHCVNSAYEIGKC